MSFLLDGKAPSIPECQQAAAALRTPEIISAITDKIMQAEQQRVKEEQEKSLHAEKEKKPESAKIHQIVRNVPREERAGGVTVPVWAMVTAVVCILLLGGALGYLAFRQPADRPPEASAEESLPQSVVQRFEELQYIGMAAAQQKAAEAAGLDAASAVFFSTKLSADGNAVRYEAELAGHDGTAYICTVDAVSGEVLSVRSEPAEYVPDPAGWLPLETLRSMALECAALEKAVFTKEKLSTESDIYYYKFEFTDSAGRSFNVHENAETGALLKYTVKEPPPANEEALISLEKAREQALSRAAASADQVIFTKEKLEGAVWMMAMTLNDGTQYTVELDARTGMANTVDVHPVSADTSQMMGMLAAKDFALKKAGLKDDGSVRFTKAKIDRSGGAYVYELAFENAEYEYEITLRAKNGEILKFRTSAL
jgi:uncharacterized membrane protein YkoI